MADKRRSIGEATALAGGTGALTGAGIGGIGSMLRGVRNPAQLARAALAGALGGGAIAGGSTALGSALLGSPDRGETSPYTARAGLGGALLGGLGGGGLGALIASGYMTRNPQLGAWLARFSPVPTKNLVGDLYSALSRNPTTARTLLGGGAGAALGSLGAGYVASDEGMGVDVLDQQLRRARRHAAP